MSSFTDNDILKDFHIHSCYSDGDLEPAEIVDRWMAEGYGIISITDHDGIEGSIEGANYVADNNLDIQFVSGIEFDSSDELAHEIHILGYGFDYDSPAIRSALSKVVLWRARRNDAIFQTLIELGYDINIEEIMAVNGGRYTGKPTFARVLVDKGYFESVTDAFEKLLDSNERLCALRKETLPANDVIDIIHEAGGIAIMAHPMEYKERSESLESYMPRLVKLMGRLVEYGIDGIECEHPSATAEEARWLKECAMKNRLVITAGSDFHSDAVKRVY